MTARVSWGGGDYSCKTHSTGSLQRASPEGALVVVSRKRYIYFKGKYLPLFGLNTRPHLCETKYSSISSHLTSKSVSALKTAWAMFCGLTKYGYGHNVNFERNLDSSK